MKILKIFGIVAGIHVFALVLIFANPGCSATTKPMPRSADTDAAPSAAAPITPAPTSASPYYVSDGTEPVVTPMITFNPDAPAAATPEIRFSPTRPGTPAAGALATEAVPNITPVSTYTVKSGDNLWAIANKHEVTVAQLAAANNMNSKAGLKPGQKLIIPTKSASIKVAKSGNAAAMEKAFDSTAARPASNGSVKHLVKSGESLGVIARNYGVKAGDIAVANHISDPAKIQAGMELIIPVGQGNAAKKTTGKSAPVTATAPAPRPVSSSPAPIAIDPPSTQQLAPPAQVPVIRIDESPITPAPKGSQ